MSPRFLAPPNASEYFGVCLSFPPPLEVVPCWNPLPPSSPLVAASHSNQLCAFCATAAASSFLWRKEGIPLLLLSLFFGRCLTIGPRQRGEKTQNLLLRRRWSKTPNTRNQHRTDQSFFCMVTKTSAHVNTMLYLCTRATQVPLNRICSVGDAIEMP